MEICWLRTLVFRIEGLRDSDIWGLRILEELGDLGIYGFGDSEIQRYEDLGIYWEIWDLGFLWCLDFWILGFGPSGVYGFRGFGIYRFGDLGI